MNIIKGNSYIFFLLLKQSISTYLFYPYSGFHSNFFKTVLNFSFQRSCFLIKYNFTLSIIVTLLCVDVDVKELQEEVVLNFVITNNTFNNNNS